MTNKRGQDLSIGMLILIVLGIIVLVLVILGFSMGWGNLWEKINIFGGSSSVNDVVTSCQLAITSKNTFSYCQEFRKIKVGTETEYLNCQDTRVKASLDGELTCAKDYNIVQCKTLINKAITGKTTPAEKETACKAIKEKVNGASCQTLTENGEPLTETNKGLCDVIKFKA